MRFFWGWSVPWLSACVSCMSPGAEPARAEAPHASEHSHAVAPDGSSSAPGGSSGGGAQPQAEHGAQPASAAALSPALPSAAPPPPTAEATAAPAPSLPAGIEVGKVVKLPVPGDRTVLVSHAPAAVKLAAVYLHGVCGDIDAIRSWAAVAAEHATLIALLADEPCADGSRYRWTSNSARQQRRIDAALSAVKRARGGLLDEQSVLLIGYSQGALRAIALRAAYPERYPRLLLGGLPAQPPTERVQGVTRVAFVAGALEGKAQVEATLKALTTAKISAQLFILPSAGHGQYGPEAPRVMGESLSWLLSDP